MAKLILVILGALFFLGGFGLETLTIYLFGTLVGLVLTLLLIVGKDRLEFPSGWKTYFLFVILTLASVYWSVDRANTFYHSNLFLAGGLFWIVSYNLGNDFKKYLPYLEIVLGICFAILFIFNAVLQEPNIIKALSLIYPSVETLNHNHIGDYWVVVLLAALGIWIKGKGIPVRIIPAALFIFSFLVLLISHSRSAYVALFAGFFYLFRGKLLKSEKYRKLFVPGFLILLSIFLVTSSFKTTIFSRAYFLQAIFGFFNNPYGVGLGNFSYISEAFTQTSDFAHNLLLEVISGIGLLSLPFFIWLFKVGKGLQTKVDGVEALMPKAVSLALFVNFFFNYTYFIPTMLWLWFVNLGVAQRR